MIERLRVRIPAGAAEEFSSLELTLCADSSSVSVPPPCYHSGMEKAPVIPQKSTSGRLHLNMHTPSTQRKRSELTMPLSRHSVESYPENEFKRNLSWNIRPQSSQLAERLWADPGTNSGISVRELIFTSSAGGE